MVAFQSPSLAFISLCCRDLAPQICLLRFYGLFHGDGLQVGDLFRDVHRPDNSTITSFDSFKVSDRGRRLLHTSQGSQGIRPSLCSAKGRLRYFQSRSRSG